MLQILTYADDFIDARFLSSIKEAFLRLAIEVYKLGLHVNEGKLLKNSSFEEGGHNMQCLLAMYFVITVLKQLHVFRISSVSDDFD